MPSSLKLAVLACVVATANGAVTQVFSSAGMQLENDFETAANSSAVVFDPTVTTGLAFQTSSGVTTSGARGALDAFANAPMEGGMTIPVSGLGFWFGNDDFGAIFNAVLSVYSGQTLLGSVSVTSNGNDHVDQFIGLTSDSPFDRFIVTYERPQAGVLDVFIDDLYLSPVPEPTGLALLGLGGGMLFRRRRLA